ncbi:hypothetical protein FHT72_004552 [Rhizobium sp. BK077]|uniref:hypothetical protein n=1 Tax=unclassified Rhizobium TaxID=2613769 RepID=UPI0017FBB2BD|nr:MULTISPECIES: hypothetical protein [unclassified Rhizobium]MBB3300906.1 hypothetical protein [Rhizobium sp. BK112]MBB3370044.1 hypothetical protein [Rhizobium sp. BK077]MBB4180796.1 hypothetical protein [Rhizobium sp. BK109]
MTGLVKRVSIREALHEPRLLGKSLLGDSWRPWRILLIALMGEELSDAERVIYHQFTGRPHEPGFIPAEFFAVAGRRSGKTRAAGTLAGYVATLVDHSAYLAASERATIPVMAASTVQAQKAFQACMVLEESPILSKQIESSNSETIRLKTRCDIEVRPGNHRTIRGITSPLAIADEVAFYFTDGQNTDSQILDAVRPSLQSGNHAGPLVCISSPYAKRGELYDAFKNHHGPNGDAHVIVAKGSSLEFNSTIDPGTIERAYKRNPTVADAEYGGNFRSDVTNLFTLEAVEASIDVGVVERPPRAGIQYFAHADPAGGSGADGFTLAIGHRENNVAVIDLLRERKSPYNPETVVADYADLLRLYRCPTVVTDAYASEWNRAAWRKAGIEPKSAPMTASEFFGALVPAVNSGQVALLDDETLKQQLVGLERRLSRGGRELISHAPNAHDDVANSVAGVVAAILKRDHHAKPMLAAPQLIPLVDYY